MPGNDSSRSVIGREVERSEAAVFLRRSERGFEALFLTGEPGIGKTAIWREVVELAKPRISLVHRASQAEAKLSYTGLSDLLGESSQGDRGSVDLVRQAIDTLAPLRRQAIRVALALGEMDQEPSDARRIGLGLLDLLRSLSRDQPVLLAVDDIQWLDRASGDALRFAVRRLYDERIGLVATFRGTTAVGDPLALVREIPDDRCRVLALGPLSASELHHLLRDRVGLDLNRPQLLRLHELSGGNPYFALEIGAELRRTGARLAASHSVALPAGLEGLLGARLDRLPQPSLGIVQVASACARPDLALLSALSGGEDDGPAAVNAAVRSGILHLDGDRLAFEHPLLASLAYQRIGDLERRSLHARLAEAATDAEEIAHHLALASTGPDEGIASQITLGAERAEARGATAAAAELAELAAERTPRHLAGLRRSRLRNSAELLRVSGDLDRSAAIFRALITESPSGGEQADALFGLARTHRTDLVEAIRLCRSALAEAGPDTARRAEILSYLSWLHQTQGRIPDAVRRARDSVDAAEAAGDSLLIARTLGRAAMAELWAMDHTSGLLERGVTLERSLQQRLPDADRASLTLARRLALTGDYGGARAIYEAVERDARERGEDVSRGRILFHLALVEWYDGQPVRALALAADALDLADQLHDDQYRSMALHAASFIDAHLGLVDRARAGASEGLRLADAVGDSLFSLAHRNVLGFIELSLGNTRRAAECLSGLPDEAISRAWIEPAFNPIWPNAIEAAALAGDLATARRHLTEFERRAARSISEWSRAVAWRCRGLVEAAEGNVEAAERAFSRAMASHGRIRAPFDRGRTLLAWGSLHRRRKRKRLAREALEEARRELAAIGAHRWAEQAAAELTRVGGRSPAGQLLTPTEARVAKLVASGLSNKEIAGAIGCTVGTVETHLTHIYTKLNLRSRVDLGRWVSVGVADVQAGGFNHQGFP